MPAVLEPGKEMARIIREAAGSLVTREISLPDFVREAWPIIEPATALKWNWHIDLILDRLAAVEGGQIKRLVINVPPRSLKSDLGSILFPCWVWTKKPWERMVFSSYAQGLSTEFSVKRRRIIKDEWFQKHWGSVVRLHDDRDLKTDFENEQMGHMMTTSTDGTITGKGGNIIIMDDPQNPKMAESAAERKSAIDHYSKTLVTRLNDKKTGAIILLQQRLHKEDNTAVVLEEGGWHHLDVQAQAEKRRVYSFLGSREKVVVEEGAYLQDEREGAAEFKGMQRSMGTRAHAAQYQQRPTSETGNIWKKHWWQFYTALPGGFNAQIQGWDLTFKKTKRGSYVVGQVWGLRGAQKYLLDQTRFRGDYPETKRAIKALSVKWPLAYAKLIEDKANGPAIIAELGGTISGIIAVNPDGDKAVRAHAVAPTIEAGDVWLPDPSICEKSEETGRPWVEDFIKECSAFTGEPGEFNDQVDTASMCLHKLNELALTLPPDTMEEHLNDPHPSKKVLRMREPEEQETFEEDPSEVFA